MRRESKYKIHNPAGCVHDWRELQPATETADLRRRPRSFSRAIARVRSLIHVTTLLLSAAPRGIDFGCPVGGCIYDADGKNYPADARFPFPGFKEYSLVLRLGTQVEQGGTDVRFTTTSSASLEICLNDDDIARTRRGGGGYEIHIQVDQLGP